MCMRLVILMPAILKSVNLPHETSRLCVRTHNILSYDSHNFFGRNAKFYQFDSFTQASIRDGNGNTALHLACINDDLNTIEALLKPITTAELKEYQQITNQLPQSNASQYFSIDLEQRNFYGK